MFYDIKKQTNLFFYHSKNQNFDCWTEYKIKIEKNFVFLKAYDIDIEKIIVQKEGENEEIVKFEWVNDYQLFFNEESFDSKLYDKLKSYIGTIKVEIPIHDDYINIKIYYIPTSDNIYLYKFKYNHHEIVCQPFCRFLEHTSEIETMLVLSDELTAICPGKLLKKNKKNDLTFLSYTQFSLHSPFSIGTYKITDMTQNNISFKIFTPRQFAFDNELKAEIFNLCINIKDYLGITDFDLNLVFSFMNSFLVSKDTIFIPISIFPHLGVDQNMYFREKFCEQLAKLICLDFYSEDIWLWFGLLEYLKLIIMRFLLGENEVLFRLKKDLEFICKNDIEEPSLFYEKNKKVRNENFANSESRFDFGIEFKRRKARFLFFVLENNITKTLMQRLICSMLARNKLNTTEFILLTKEVTGRELKKFMECYVYRPGIVECIINYEIDRKGKVDVVLTQKPTSIKNNANKTLIFPLKLKVFELEGTYEHKFFNNKVNFQCHIRTRKRKVDVKENEEQTEPKEDDTLNYNPLLFMHADPNVEHIAKIEIQQPDYAFIEQLQTEKNVFSQFAVIKILSENPSQAVYQAFDRVMNDPHTFYKIRLMILLSFTKMRLEESPSGIQRLVNYYVKKFCMPGSSIPKPLDYANITNYYILKALTASLSFNEGDSTNDDGKGTETTLVIKSILSLLNFNLFEDSNNYYNTYPELLYSIGNITNGNFISFLINALSLILSNPGKKIFDFEDFFANMERKRLNDILFPSYQNLITASVIKLYSLLHFLNIIRIDFKILKRLALEDNSILVRELAIGALILNFFEETWIFIFWLLVHAERSLKIFILEAFKIVLQLKIGNEKTNEKYNRAYVEINQTCMKETVFFEKKLKFKRLYESEEVFYDLLKLFFYDSVFLELLTDIIYLLNDKVRVKATEIEEIIVENVVIPTYRMKVNMIDAIKLNLTCEYPEIKKKLEMLKSQKEKNLEKKNGVDEVKKRLKCIIDAEKSLYPDIQGKSAIEVEIKEKIEKAFIADYKPRIAVKIKPEISAMRVKRFKKDVLSSSTSILHIENETNNNEQTVSFLTKPNTDFLSKNYNIIFKDFGIVKICFDKFLYDYITKLYKFIITFLQKENIYDIICTEPKKYISFLDFGFEISDEIVDSFLIHLSNSLLVENKILEVLPSELFQHDNLTNYDFILEKTMSNFPEEKVANIRSSVNKIMFEYRPIIKLTAMDLAFKKIKSEILLLIKNYIDKIPIDDNKVILKKINQIDMQWCSAEVCCFEYFIIGIEKVIKNIDSILQENFSVDILLLSEFYSYLNKSIKENFKLDITNNIMFHTPILFNKEFKKFLCLYSTKKHTFYLLKTIFVEFFGEKNDFINMLMDKSMIVVLKEGNLYKELLFKLDNCYYFTYGHFMVDFNAFLKCLVKSQNKVENCLEMHKLEWLMRETIEKKLIWCSKL